jgi:hypothetical protein
MKPNRLKWRLQSNHTDPSNKPYECFVCKCDEINFQKANLVKYSSFPAKALFAS